MDEKPERRSSPGGSLSDRLSRGDVFEPDCPSRTVMKHVTSSWGVLVLIALQSGTMRFGELRRRVNGVSERMLSQTLQWLELDGLVSRRAYPVMPPHTDYSLTELGQQAAQKVASLADWIESSLPRIVAGWKEQPLDGSVSPERLSMDVVKESCAMSGYD